MTLHSVQPAPMQLVPGAPPPWPAPTVSRPPARPAPSYAWVTWCAVGGFCVALGIPFVVLHEYVSEPDQRLFFLGFGLLCSILGVTALIAMTRSLRSRNSVFAHEINEHEILMARLVSGWARILRSEIVGSRHGSEGGLTHYQLALELELWPGDEAGYRAVPTPVACTLHTDVDVALAGHIVPGTFFGMAYDSASTARLFPQCLVTMQGAVLPV